MVVQAHAIGTSRKQALEMIVDRGSANCGTALATTLKKGGDSKPYHRPLMVIELDSLLDSAAACYRFSDASLRRRYSHISRHDATEELIRAFRRMTPL